MFISSAFASTTSAATTAATNAATPAAGLAGILSSFAPLLLVIFIFYFFLVRPQQKRMAEYQKLVAGLRKGDRVVTSGGIIGTVHRVETNNPDVVVEIAENVRVRIQRSAIAEILAKTEPVADSTEQKSA